MYRVHVLECITRHDSRWALGLRSLVNLRVNGVRRVWSCRQLASRPLWWRHYSLSTEWQQNATTCTCTKTIQLNTGDQTGWAKWTTCTCRWTLSNCINDKTLKSKFSKIRERNKFYNVGLTWFSWWAGRCPTPAQTQRPAERAVSQPGRRISFCSASSVMIFVWFRFA